HGKAISFTSRGSGAGHTLTRQGLDLPVGTYVLPAAVKSQLVSIAVGGAGGVVAGLGGSVNLDFVRDSLDAHISNTPAGKAVHARGNGVVTGNQSASLDTGRRPLGPPPRHPA